MAPEVGAGIHYGGVRLVYTPDGPADVVIRSALLDGIGEVCWWKCPHGQRIVCPASWVRYLTCGPEYVGADGRERGHRFAPALWARDAVVNTVPIWPQIMIWTEEASREQAGDPA